ncbi:hypothetical protein LZ30DRAFT_161855 [Colletotrichum cereale]|nr:hypothetical protein LZ30DRAFT_161855 [Colletotrichum cereale]
MGLAQSTKRVCDREGERVISGRTCTSFESLPAEQTWLVLSKPQWTRPAPSLLPPPPGEARRRLALSKLRGFPEPTDRQNIDRAEDMWASLSLPSWMLQCPTNRGSGARISTIGERGSLARGTRQAHPTRPHPQLYRHTYLVLTKAPVLSQALHRIYGLSQRSPVAITNLTVSGLEEKRKKNEEENARRDFVPCCTAFNV